MLRGEFRQFSVERLLRFLVALNHDVEIVINRTAAGTDTAALACVLKASASHPASDILPPPPC